MLSDPAQETPQWIIDRLHTQREYRSARDNDTENGTVTEWKQPWDGDPDLLPLETIDRKTSSPHSVCGAVIEGLGLSSRISSWGNVAQRSSNLDSILKHVASYEDEMLGSGQAATLGGAILYLEMLASDKNDIKFPPYGQDAVTILTYHKAKGLQWPVVILSGLNSDRDPNLWEPHVSGGGENINQPLAGRAIRAWTWPFGKTDGQFPKLRTGTRLETDVTNSPEGLQRAAEEQEENMRLLYVGCTRFVQWITSSFPDAKWRVEVPVTAGRAEGGTWNGTLDLILELPDGKLVVIDHKSAPIRRSHCESKALQYVGQLAAYEEALSGLGYTVDSTWIHFPLAGIAAKVNRNNVV